MLVGAIEQKIRVIKERARGMINTLPCKKLPKLMVIELLHFCAMWMNSFSIRSGISDKWTPCELVSRHKLDATLHCMAPFESYCEMHLDPEITNTMDPRTKQAICLGPTEIYSRGAMSSYHPRRGMMVTQKKFTEMPITESIIKQVEMMAVKGRVMKGLSFKNRKGIKYKL
jgi:hypothetical protein